MDFDPEAVKLAIFLTAAGAPLAAGIISGIVEMGKAVWRGHERLAAFVLSVAIVVGAIVERVQAGALILGVDTIFLGFMAWYAIGRLALTVHDDFTQKPNSLTGTDTP